MSDQLKQAIEAFDQANKCQQLIDEALANGHNLAAEYQYEIQDGYLDQAFNINETLSPEEQSIFFNYRISSILNSISI